MSNQTIDTLKKIDAKRTLGLPLTASETAMLTFYGKNAETDAAAVDYQDNIKGKDVVVTDAGKVLKASVVRPTQSGLVPLVDGKGYTPHWATCPFAKEHRGSRK